MGLIADLTPLNAKTEREKFLASDDYNPQFEYLRSFNQQELQKYGQPDLRYFQHAQQMLEQYGIPERSKPKAEQKQTQPSCTKDQTRQIVEKLLAKLDLPPIPIHFSQQYSSQVMISSTGIHFRTPIKFSAISLKNKLNHEVQTHYLRRFNQSQQSWNLHSSEKNPRLFRTTEEGLANLHSYLDRPDTVIRKTYLNYFAAYSALEMSFRELYDQLLQLGVKKSLAWNLTLKQKRGLKDTGQPGSGFPKNHVYFEGAVKVWHWLSDDSNDPHQLYWGRISLQDLAKVQSLPISNQLIYPTFFADLSTYHQFINKIGQKNQFAELPVLP